MNEPLLVFFILFAIITFIVKDREYKKAVKELDNRMYSEGYKMGDELFKNMERKKFE